MIEAKVVEDSISPSRKRITTLQLVYPRFIHSEFMTHRVFSRNASSSRAIPVAKMIDQVRNNPAMPIEWGKNQPGMQARELMLPEDVEFVESSWKLAASLAADSAEALAAHGLHKQIVNRVLEPFQWMHTIVTATEWDNFFDLRDHVDAQPEIAALARSMRTAMQLSKPVERYIHAPYTTEEDRQLYNQRMLCLVSAARCARVSYLNHDGSEPNRPRDLELASKLMTARHMSPFEHQANYFSDMTRSRNFVGWLQFREAMELHML